MSKITCVTCGNCDAFDQFEDTHEILCLKCGILFQAQERSFIQEYINEGPKNQKNQKNQKKQNPQKNHQKYDFENHKTFQCDLIMEDYLKILSTTWCQDDLKAVEDEMRKINQTIKENETLPVRALMLAVILKYATQRSISCDLRVHRDQMKINAKVFGRALAYVKAGIISEGLCNKEVQDFVSRHGDTSMIRPKSLIGKGHRTTQSLGEKIKEQNVHDRKRHTICFISHEAEKEENLELQKTQKTQKTRQNLVSLLGMYEKTGIFLNDEEQQELFKTHAVLVRDPRVCREGDIAVNMACLCIIFQKYGKLKNVKEMCLRVRLTSAPTLNRMILLEKKILVETFET